MFAKKKREKNRPLRIAMIGHKRIPTREGGVEIVVKELAVRMVALGNKVDAYNRWDLFTKDGKVGGHEYQGVRILQIPTLHNGKVNAFMYSVLATIRALFGNYDVLHYHAIGSCAMLWLTKLFGKKTIATVHGLDWQRAKWNKFASVYLKFGEKMAAKYADTVIVLNKANKEYFLEQYHRETILIPNGMDFKPVPKPSVILDKYGVERGDYVLFLARIVPEKGLHYLIDAFKQINTNKRLIIAGGMDYENEYCRKIEEMAKSDSRIIFAGFVQGLELEELFGNCALYVLPSDIEGMPISLLEAMSYRARCLVSDIDENVETSKGFAATFKHSNVESLRDEIVRILNDPQKEAPDVSGAFESWDRVTEETLELYYKVLGKESGVKHG